MRVEVRRERFYPNASGFVAFLSFSGGLLRWYYTMILYILRLNEQTWIKHLLLSSNVSVWHICGRTQATEKKATRLESDVHLSHCIQDVSICLMMQLHTNQYIFITYIHTPPPFFFLRRKCLTVRFIFKICCYELPQKATQLVKWLLIYWQRKLMFWLVIREKETVV